MLHPLDKLKIEYIFNTFSIVSLGSFLMILAIILFLSIYPFIGFFFFFFGIILFLSFFTFKSNYESEKRAVKNGIKAGLFPGIKKNDFGKIYN